MCTRVYARVLLYYIVKSGFRSIEKFPQIQQPDMVLFKGAHSILITFNAFSTAMRSIEVDFQSLRAVNAVPSVDPGHRWLVLIRQVSHYPLHEQEHNQKHFLRRQLQVYYHNQFILRLNNLKLCLRFSFTLSNQLFQRPKRKIHMKFHANRHDILI